MMINLALPKFLSLADKGTMSEFGHKNVKHVSNLNLSD